MIEHMPKKDLVITAARGYQWEQLRPFAISLDQTGFTGDKVVLDAGLPAFTQDCLRNRGYQLVRCDLPKESFVTAENKLPLFNIFYRYIPLLAFLKEHGSEYRYVVWVDCGDQIFQSNPSDWLTEHATPHTFIAAREGWLIKDETTWNDVWVKETCPDDYDWLREHEVICAGTMAGDAAILHDTILEILKMIEKCQTLRRSVWGADQAFLNYLLYKPFPTYSFIPDLNLGWTATISSVITENFTSCCGFPKEKIAIAPPVFEPKGALVLTPDGKKPFVLVHQYNRDGRWTYAMMTKFREW
jgi:hypothetical protein